MPLTVTEARNRCVCRICEGPILIPAGQPFGWQFDFGEMVYPTHVVLHFGKEFAHGMCHQKEVARLEEAMAIPDDSVTRYVIPEGLGSATPATCPHPGDRVRTDDDGSPDDRRTEECTACGSYRYFQGGEPSPWYAGHTRTEGLG